MRAGFALFHGCRLRLKPGPYNTTKSIPTRPLRLFVVDGTPHCVMLLYLNPNIKNGIFPAIIISMRAGIALFKWCRLRLKPGPYSTTQSIHACPLLFVIWGTPHCPLLSCLNLSNRTSGSFVLSLHLPRIITITSNFLPLAPCYGVSHSPLSSCIFRITKRKRNGHHLISFPHYIELY